MADIPEDVRNGTRTLLRPEELSQGMLEAIRLGASLPGLGDGELGVLQGVINRIPPGMPITDAHLAQARDGLRSRRG